MEPVTIILGGSLFFWVVRKLFGGNSDRSDSTQNDSSGSSRSGSSVTYSDSYTTESLTYQSENSDISTRYRTGFTEDDIQWTEIVEPSTIDFPDKKVEEYLINLIGQKDRVSGEVFRQFKKVHFCVDCQLGYHEDSWEYLNRTCEQCGESGNKVKMYVLPSISEVSNSKNYNSPDTAGTKLKNPTIQKPSRSKSHYIKPKAPPNTSSASSYTDNYNASNSDENYIRALDSQRIASNIGQVISIKGRIDSVGVNNGSIFFNFDSPTSRCFCAYVPPSSSSNFANPYSYVNQDIIVSGKLEIYKGRPQIVLHDSSQLRRV